MCALLVARRGLTSLRWALPFPSRALLLKLNSEHQPVYCEISDLSTCGGGGALCRTICAHDGALPVLHAGSHIPREEGCGR